MLTLNDGRPELWQWDTGRTLAVDADCSQVHFSNKVFGRSIDVDVVNGAAIIPDVLLQTDNDLNVWAFVGTAENGYTKIRKTFKVNRRNKPADYVFTPTDQMTLQTIQSQIGDLADLTTEAKDTLVAAINEAARTGGGAGSMDLRVADGYVQYSTDGGMTWTNLIAMAEIKGADGITPTIGSNGNWYLGDTDTGKPSRGEKGDEGQPGKDGQDGSPGKDGNDGQPGKDGTSPVISVSAITGGHRITITDANGTKTVDVMDGSDGKNGADGQPGADGSNGQNGQDGSDGVGIQSVEQTTTSTEDGGTNVVTVTKTDGTSSTFSVKNGSKGSKGDTGAQGEPGADGAAGADGKSAYQYAQEGGYTGTETEFAEKLAQRQLTGTTNDLTPTQVYDAVSAGIPVKVQYIDSTYGLLSFTAFNVAESLNVIVSQTIVYFKGLYILAELIGDKSGGTWAAMFATLAQKTDIPSALPNPNALTFTGAVTGSYDGSEAVTVEIPSGTGLSSAEKTAMLTLFKAAAYTANVSATITQLETLWGGGGESGGGESGGGETGTTYSVTNNLTNVTSNNSATTVEAGSSYSATLTVADGNVLNSIVITMGGVDITDSVYGDGSILISEVTGDIVITAVAGKTILYQLSGTPKSVAGLSEDTGIAFGASDANGYVKALTICIAYTGFDAKETLMHMSSGSALIFNANGAGTTRITCCSNAVDVSPALSETGDSRIVIAKNAKSEKTISVHTLSSGEVKTVSIVGSYGNFAHSACAGNLLVGSSDITVNNFTIYEGILSSADIAAFLSGGDI